MILEDFISFGRTVPSNSKKYGKSVCMAGYSPEFNRLFRVYPWPTGFKIRCRSMIRIHLERNKQDSREESWAIKGRNPYESVRIIKEKVENNKLQEYLEGNTNHSIKRLNEEKKSLGILRATWMVPEIIERDEPAKADGHIKVGEEFKLKPYLRFVDYETERCLQVRDWGMYELMRKYDRLGRKLTRQDIENSLYIKGQKDVYFIVGNMAHQRSSWLIIKVFAFPKVKQLKIDDLKVFCSAG